MKQFNDKNFVLETEVAQDLYHNHAAKMPIIDYHCHLIPEMVANDHRFKSITELWLGGDHYKWRAMRTNGVDEKYCTGKDTSDWEKFEKWAETVPYTLRNSSCWQVSWFLKYTGLLGTCLSLSPMPVC